MYKLNAKENELRKLYQLLDKIKEASLGSDYQTRMQMKDIESKAIERIKSLKSIHNEQL